MNNTKWDELRLAMYGLGVMSPAWRTRDRTSGYVSEWDGEWYYHFRGGGYECIEWVEIATLNSDQHEAVRTALRDVHVPGEEMSTGFRVYGFAESGQVLEYL